MKESPSSAWFICFFREIFIYIFLPFSPSVFSSEVEVLFSWLPAKSCAFLGVKSLTGILQGGPRLPCVEYRRVFSRLRKGKICLKYPGFPWAQLVIA